jgi:hypothetical protein
VEGSICHVRWTSGRDAELKEEKMAKLLYDADTSYYPVGTRVKKRFSDDSVKSGRVVSLDDSLYHILYEDKSTEVVGTSEMDQIVNNLGHRTSSTRMAMEAPESESKTKMQTPGQSTGPEACATTHGNRDPDASSRLIHQDNNGVESRMTTPGGSPKILEMTRETPTVSAPIGIPEGDRLDVPAVESSDEQWVGKAPLEKTRASNAQSEKALKVMQEPSNPPANDEVRGDTPQARWDRQEHLRSSFSPSDAPSRIKSVTSQLQNFVSMARGCFALPVLDSTSAEMESARIANDCPPPRPVVAKDPPSPHSEKPQPAEEVEATDMTSPKKNSEINNTKMFADPIDMLDKSAIKPTDDEGKKGKTAVVHEADITALEAPVDGEDATGRSESSAPAGACSLDGTVESVAGATRYWHMPRSIAQTEEQHRVASSTLQDDDAKDSTHDSQTDSTAVTGDKAQALHHDRKTPQPLDKGINNESASEGSLGEIDMVLVCNLPTPDVTISMPCENVQETKKEESGRGMTGPLFAGNERDSSFANALEDESLLLVGTATAVHDNNCDHTPPIALNQAIDVDAAIDGAGAIDDSRDEKTTLVPLDTKDSIPKIQFNRAPLIRVDQAFVSHPSKDSAESPAQLVKLVEPPSNDTTDVRCISEVNNEKPVTTLKHVSSLAVAESVAVRRPHPEKNIGKHAQPRPSGPRPVGRPRLPLAGSKLVGRPIPKHKPAFAAGREGLTGAKLCGKSVQPSERTKSRPRGAAWTKKRKGKTGKAQPRSLDYSKLYPRTQGNDEVSRSFVVPSHLLEQRGAPFVGQGSHSLSQEASAKRNIMSVLLSRPPDRKSKVEVTKKAAETSGETFDATATPLDGNLGICSGKEMQTRVTGQDRESISIHCRAQSVAPDGQKVLPEKQQTPPFGAATTQGRSITYPLELVSNKHPIEPRASATSGSSARQPWNPSATPGLPNYWGYRSTFAQPPANASRGAPKSHGETRGSSDRSDLPTSEYIRQRLAWENLVRNPALHYASAQPGLAGSLAACNQAHFSNPFVRIHGAQAPDATPIRGAGQRPFTESSAASLAAYIASSRQHAGKGDPPAPHVNQAPH